MKARGGTLVIACGALAREIAALRRANQWDGIDVRCLPAELHNRPERIAPAVRAELRAQRAHYSQIFVAYGDCGTGGHLDAVLREEGAERLPGAHCYEFFATPQVFAALAEAEPGTFYLTDFLLKNFERFVIRPLGLDRHPELRDEYFRNYKRLVYLAQVEKPDNIARAQAIAQDFGFSFEYRLTGYGQLGSRLQALAATTKATPWPA